MTKALATSERFAAAKVNLFLHVGPPAGDGYHPVSSLMVFADVGDRLRLRDGDHMAFRLEGPFASALAGDSDNLVTRARDRLIAGLSPPPRPFELVLEKALPIAAGLGGGSADAAAALALIAERLAQEDRAPAPERLAHIARELGADVAACLDSRPVIGRGRGDELSPAPPIPPLPAVLVNPMVPSATGPVYRAYDRLAVAPRADDPDLPAALASVDEVAAFLHSTRNDLQSAAIALQPRIGAILADLRSAPEAVFARMSGSGATCFALCATSADAASLAARIARAHDDWWVRDCTFGGR